MVTVVSTKGKHGYAVEWCPYNSCRIACAASQYFGIAGGGSVVVVDIDAGGGVQTVCQLEWPSGLYDVVWSEQTEHCLATASADGSLLLWHLTSPQKPSLILKEHSNEVHAVDWSLSRSVPLLLTGSWDCTLKVWDVLREKSLATYCGHTNSIYSAIWAPLIAGSFASTSGDQSVRVWDIRLPPTAAQVCRLTQSSEVIAADWSRYDQHLLLTGAADSAVRAYDLRNPTRPLFTLTGHEYAVRRLKCSPFDGNKLISCSYDFTVRVWDFSVQGTPTESVAHHSEFVCGIDFNLHDKGQIADCSWDSTIKIYSPQTLLNRVTSQ